MMRVFPPSRHHDRSWNVSRMNDKKFSTSLQKIVGGMLEPNPDDRPDALVLVGRVDEEYRRWRTTTKEGLNYVDVVDTTWGERTDCRS